MPAPCFLPNNPVRDLLCIVSALNSSFLQGIPTLPELRPVCPSRCGNQKKVDELNKTPGNTIESTTDPTKIKEADFVIIAVPTQITKAKDPDLEPVVVAHKQFRQMPADQIRSLMNDTPVMIDVYWG